jgi:hypothetical protein
MFSAAISVFGVMAGIWGGFKQSEWLLFLIFWTLPSLSFPVFLLYFFYPRAAGLCSLVLVLGIYVTLRCIGLQDYLAGQSTATNIASITLGIISRPSYMWLQGLAALFLNLASWIKKAGYAGTKQATPDSGL